MFLGTTVYIVTMFFNYFLVSTISLVAATLSTEEEYPLDDMVTEPEPSTSTFKSSFEGDIVYLETPESMDTKLVSSSSTFGISSDVIDFVGLIPTQEVRSVIGNYYRNDRTVREGVEYLKNSHFLERLLNVTEVDSLVRYLNETGLDVEFATDRIMEIVGDADHYSNMLNNTLSEKNQSNNTDIEFTGGMHVMVDSVLEVIPQDEILNMFFEKMDSSMAFIMFFNKVREPKFGYLFQNLEESEEMKYLIYDLHNHGINMEKIIDSLKNYFFLGTFN